MARAPRGDDLPGADDRIEPDPAHRRSVDGRAARASPPGPARGAGARRRAAARHDDPRSGPDAARLSLRIVRRHAPTGDGCDGVFLRSGAADRRRAHHGAGRDRAAPGAATAAPPGARAGRRDPVHHPRHGGGVAVLRPGVRHVRGNGGRAGADRPGAGRAAPSLHARPAGRPAGARRARRRAGLDPGPGAGHAPAAARLRVLGPLRLRRRGLSPAARVAARGGCAAGRRRHGRVPVLVRGG